MNKHFVANAQDIPVGSRKIIEIKGREIGVFNVNGRFLALQNICPHQGAPICLGEINGTNKPSDPNQFNWQREGEIIRCPWHAWEFDLLTGQSLFDSQIKVKTFNVEVIDERIIIEL